MTRIVLVDDHQVVRTGLTQLLAGLADIDVVGSAASGEEAVSLVVDVQPDVVLMDLSMPGIGGVEATRRIKAVDAGVRVIILTSFSDRGRILDALDAGAIGYLLKDADPEELVRGIRAAARGDWPLDPRAARLLLAGGRERARGPELSGRELEVLALVAQGLANKVIARKLGITERTVKAHLTRIFQQIGVTDRTQAALWAQRQGMGEEAGPHA